MSCAFHVHHLSQSSLQPGTRRLLLSPHCSDGKAKAWQSRSSEVTRPPCVDLGAITHASNHGASPPALWGEGKVTVSQVQKRGGGSPARSVSDGKIFTLESTPWTS